MKQFWIIESKLYLDHVSEYQKCCKKCKLHFQRLLCAKAKKKKNIENIDYLQR